MTTPNENWPTSDERTIVTERADTLVGGPPPPPGPPPAPPGGPGDRRIGLGMLLGLGALGLVAAGILIAWLLTHRSDNNHATTVVVTTHPATTALPPKVSVPRVVGLKEDAAVIRLGQAGLRPKRIYRPTRLPKGIVVAQKPEEATEAKRGSRVTLVIDAGAPKVAVPDLTGKSFTDAKAALDKLGLDATRTQVTSTQPAGTVLDQVPKPGGKVAKGSNVTLSVARAAPQQTPTTTTAPAQTTPQQTTPQQTTTAPAPTTTTAVAPKQPTSATMPNVSGQTQAAAVQSMANAGILVSVVFVPSDQPLGTVVQQAKPAGTTVPYHSHVQVNISRGPNNNPPQTVPNVVGQTLQQAVSSVNGHNLRLIYVKFPVTTQSQAGKVVQQSPQGGQAPRNAQVVVYLGAYRQ